MSKLDYFGASFERLLSSNFYADLATLHNMLQQMTLSKQLSLQEIQSHCYVLAYFS